MKNKLKKSLEESVNTKKKLIKLDNKIQNSIDHTKIEASFQGRFEKPIVLRYLF